MGGLSLRRRLPHRRTWIGEVGRRRQREGTVGASGWSRGRAKARTAKRDEKQRRDVPGIGAPPQSSSLLGNQASAVWLPAPTG